MKHECPNLLEFKKLMTSGPVTVSGWKIQNEKCIDWKDWDG